MMMLRCEELPDLFFDQVKKRCIEWQEDGMAAVQKQQEVLQKLEMS